MANNTMLLYTDNVALYGGCTRWALYVHSFPISLGNLRSAAYLGTKRLDQEIYSGPNPRPSLLADTTYSLGHDFPRGYSMTGSKIPVLGNNDEQPLLECECQS